MNCTEPSTKAPSPRTGLFATLRASLRLSGISAPSARRPALAAAALALLALALTASPASASTPNFCPSGSAAGQCNFPRAVAVDQSTGHVYVGESNNARISEFDEEGHFLRAFGFGVANGADELQTCEALCIQGLFSGLRPIAVAVDSSGGPSAHDVYAFNGSRVEKYELNPLTEEYELLLSFGSSGTGPGQFSGQAHPIALDASNSVWVGDNERLEQFSEAGAFLSEVKLPGAGEVQSLALDASGEFYVKSSEVAGVQKLKPSGELLETLDASGHPNALALDSSGNLFISDQLEPNLVVNFGKATLLSYDSSGAQTEAFASGEVIGAPVGNAIAFGDTGQRLYVASNTAALDGSAAQAFAVPAPGPLPVSGTTEAKEIKKLSATLCARVNPEGAETKAEFQYITAAQYQAQKAQAEAEGKAPEEVAEAAFAGALQTSESASLGEDFSFAHELCQPVSPLTPATAYRFRILAHNVNGEVKGEAAEAETLPPAAIDSTGAAEVTADSATLEAEINPLGDETFYRFEYLTAAEYEENLAAGPDGFSGAHSPTSIPVPDAPLGAGSSDVSVSQHLQGLAPHTAYRYRVLIRNAVSEANGGPFPGPTLTFTTQSPAAPGLPDTRAWELVSPSDKRGANLIGTAAGEGVTQAAASGAAMTYIATAPTEAQPPGYADGIGRVQVLSARGPSGWTSRNFATPHSVLTAVNVGLGYEYRFFSPDLSLGLVQPFGPFEPSISPAASEQTPFLHTDFPPADPTAFCTTSCYRPLVSGCPESEPCPPAVEAIADVPLGTEFGKEGKCLLRLCGPQFLGATPDLSHVVLSSEVPLTETTPTATKGGLYEWSAAAPPAAALRLISVLPDGQPLSDSQLGLNQFARNAISADGSRVVFSSLGHLYLRYNATEAQSQIEGGQCTEPTKACTLQLDALQGGPGGSQAPAPRFQLASAEGSRLFFTDSQQLTADSGAGSDLYEYDLEKPLGERLTDLTPAAAGQAAAVQGLVIGASEDGSFLYFVADGVQASNQGADGSHAASGDCHLEGLIGLGACNLYLTHEGTTTYIATLSGADGPSWAGFLGQLEGLAARVSPDGRWLAFMSQRPLTGYDNRDAVSGKPDKEVFLYHAAAEGGEGSLVCASCNPSGARPHGEENCDACLISNSSIWKNQWLAANIPAWTPYRLQAALYQSRYLSNSGRLFFNSSDALLPQDSNGNEDVYTYEPPGVGDCTESKPTFAPASGGCLGLISSGASAEESAFLDASENGDDVFFLTTAKLTPKDFDTSLDVYDARVGGGEIEPVKPVECSGDACQQPAVPPNDATPGSLTFHGAGNVHEPPVKKKHPKKHHKHKKSHKQHKRAANNHRRANR